MKRYIVTKLFLDGILKGMTHTETTNVKFVVGKVYEAALTNTHYKILFCEEEKSC